MQSVCVLMGLIMTRFFSSSAELGIQRADVRALLNDIEKAISPLQTLCDSPRKNERNTEALAAVSETCNVIAHVLSESHAESQLARQEEANLETKPSSSAPRM